MNRLWTITSVAVVCVMAGHTARAQSLVDAAKSAEAQSHSVRYSLGVYTNQSLGGGSGYEALLGDRYLLADHFSAYSGAHADIVQLRVQNRQLDDYLVRFEFAAKDRFDLENAYRQEPSILDVFRLHHIDVRTYFKTDAAYMRALRDQKLTKADREHLPDGRRLNAQYVEDKSLTHWLNSSWQEQHLGTLHQARAR